MRTITAFVLFLSLSFNIQAQDPFMHEIIDGAGLSAAQLKQNAVEWILAYQKRDKEINKNLRNVRDLSLKYPVYSWKKGDSEVIQTCNGVEIKGTVFTYTLTIEIKDNRALVVLDNVLFTTMALPGADFNSISDEADKTGILLGKKGFDKRIEEKIKPMIIDYINTEYLPSLRGFMTKKPYNISGW